MTQIAVSEVSSVPKEWPGAFRLFKFSKAAIGYNIWTIIGLFVLSIALSLAVSALFPADSEGNQSLFARLIDYLLGTVVSIAMAVTLLASVRREKVSFADAFSRVKPMLYVKYIGLSIVLGITYTLSLLALIVPFFFVAPRLSVALYYLVDTNASITDAFKASWRDTKGNVGKVYGIVGVNILIVLTAILIITIPLTIFLAVAYSAAFVLLYKYISTKPAADSLATEQI